MKKNEVINQFLKQTNDCTLPIAELYKKYIQSIEDENYHCSPVYFSNICKKELDENETNEVVKLKVEKETVKVEYTTSKASDIQYSEDILIPIKSNTAVDNILSYSIGLMPATVIMVPGESGSGKTTVCLKYLESVKLANPDKSVLMVSSEMNSIHMYKYNRRLNINNIDICLLSESESPTEELTEILKQGWDIVLLDSLADTINKIRDEQEWSEKKTEKYVLTLMDKVRRGNNKKNKYTSFLCTHHMTKGGSYTGSTNLKHMTDAMLFLIVDQDNPNAESHMVFVKNRDGKTRNRLYYKLINEGVEYNVARFESDENVRSNQNRTEEILKEKTSNFKSLFGLKKVSENVEENSYEYQITQEEMHVAV